MEEKNRRVVRSTGSTLEPDESDVRRPGFFSGQDPMPVHHYGPRGQVPNPGPSRRGVTEVDGAAPVAQHRRSLFDTGTTDGIIHEGKQFTGDSHGVRLGNEGTFAGRKDRVDQDRTLWDEGERSSCQPIPAGVMSCRTQESVTAQESSSSSFNASRVPADDLQDTDLYGPPPAQAVTVGQDFTLTRFVFPHSVMDHTLSSSSSSSGSYHSASSLPPGSIGSVFMPGPPVDSEQMEGVRVDHVATGIASVQLDDVEMDDTETAANQAAENYAVTAETVRLANRLFRQNSEGDTYVSHFESSSSMITLLLTNYKIMQRK